MGGGGSGHSIFHPPQPGQPSFAPSSLSLETLGALPGCWYPQGWHNSLLLPPGGWHSARITQESSSPAPQGPGPLGLPRPPPPPPPRVAGRHEHVRGEALFIEVTPRGGLLLSLLEWAGVAVTGASSVLRLHSQGGRPAGRWAVLLGPGTSGLGSAPCSPGSPVTCSWRRENGGRTCGEAALPISALHVAPRPFSSHTLTLGHIGYSRGQTADAGSPRCLCRSSPGRSESEESHKHCPLPLHPLLPGKGPTQGSSAPLASGGLLSDWLVHLALCRPSNEKERPSSCPSPLPTHPPLAGQLRRTGRALSVSASQLSSRTFWDDETFSCCANVVGTSTVDGATEELLLNCV